MILIKLNCVRFISSFNDKRAIDRVAFLFFVNLNIFMLYDKINS